MLDLVFVEEDGRKYLPVHPDYRSDKEIEEFLVRMIILFSTADAETKNSFWNMIDLISFIVGSQDGLIKVKSFDKDEFYDLVDRVMLTVFNKHDYSKDLEFYSIQR